MVSSVLRMSDAELVETLERIQREHGEDPAYRELRGDLPADWPM